MKSLIVIFVVLIVGIIFIAVWDISSPSTIDDTDYNELSWRLPVDKEINKLKDSFFQSNIEECSDYFIKKFVGEKYLIACDLGNNSWEYYTVYASQNKMYLTPRDLISSLDPPKSLQENAEIELVRQIPGKTEKTTLPEKAETVETK